MKQQLPLLLSAGFPIVAALGLGYVVIRKRLHANGRMASLSRRYLPKLEAFAATGLTLDQAKHAISRALPRLYVLDGLSSGIDAFVTLMIEEEQNLDAWQMVLAELRTALTALVKDAQYSEQESPESLLGSVRGASSRVDKILDEILAGMRQVRPFLVKLLERVAAEPPEFEDNPENAAVLLEGYLRAVQAIATSFLGRLEKAVLVAPARGEELAIDEHETLLPIVSKTIKVFYATERVQNLRGARNGGDAYGTKSSGQLEYGHATVELPESKSLQEDRARREADPLYRIQTIIVEVDPAYGGNQNKFGDALKAETRQTGRTSEALLFIHGYNNSFTDAVNRTAQVAYELGFMGVPVTYDWASAHNPAKYVTDRKQVAATRFRLRDFLIFMSQLGLEKLHIVAHSMGNQALNKAFEELRLENRKLQTSTMTFAAPDVDSREFANDMIPRRIIPCLDEGVVLTLYWASDDIALWYSFLAHGCRRRAGNALVRLDHCKKLYSVDGSGVSVSDRSFHHAYFGDSCRVLNDLEQALHGCSVMAHPRATWLKKHQELEQHFVLLP